MPKQKNPADRQPRESLMRKPLVSPTTLLEVISRGFQKWKSKLALQTSFGAACAAFSLPCSGQLINSEDPEHFRIEVSGSGWLLNTGGTQKQRIVLEGTPLSIHGSTPSLGTCPITVKPST